MSEVISCFQLGRRSFDAASQIQTRAAEEVRQGRLERLLLMELSPVFTVGQKPHPEHVLVGEQTLEDLGAEIRQTDRGGDVTFHGPGQLICYPVLDIGRRRIGPRDFVCRLEEVMIAVLGRYGLEGVRREQLPGVWLDGEKVGALGVRIRAGVSTHGFALNIDPDLSWFEHIVPCGLTGSRATSIASKLDAAPPMAEVQTFVIEEFSRVFGVETRLDSFGLETAEEATVGG